MISAYSDCENPLTVILVANKLFSPPLYALSRLEGQSAAQQHYQLGDEQSERLLGAQPHGCDDMSRASGAVSCIFSCATDRADDTRLVLLDADSAQQQQLQQ